MKKILVLISATFFLMIFTSISFATTMYNDRASWESAVGSFVETTDYPDSLPAGTGFDIGYSTDLSFNINLGSYAIGGGWATWSGGYTGEVLTDFSSLSMTGTLTSGLAAFGFEAEPNPFETWDITLLLQDGSILTQAVEGNSGAKFFGFAGSTGISSFTISSEQNFAIGRFVAGTGSPVPEPTTMLLFGAGLLGLAGVNRRKK